MHLKKIVLDIMPLDINYHYLINLMIASLFLGYMNMHLEKTSTPYSDTAPHCPPPPPPLFNICLTILMAYGHTFGESNLFHNLTQNPLDN